MNQYDQIHQLIKELHQILPFNLIEYNHEDKILHFHSFTRRDSYHLSQERAILFLQDIIDKMPEELKGTGFEMELKEA